MTDTETPTERQTSADQRRAVRIMAKALFQQFQLRGYSKSHVIDFTSELLELLTESLRAHGPTASSGSELVHYTEGTP